MQARANFQRYHGDTVEMSQRNYTTVHNPREIKHVYPVNEPALVVLKLS